MALLTSLALNVRLWNCSEMLQKQIEEMPNWEEMLYGFWSGMEEANVWLPWTPPIQQMPSPQNAFVFFHLRKCGGSTVRALLERSLQMHNFPANTYVIPCHTHDCRTYDIPYVPLLTEEYEVRTNNSYTFKYYINNIRTAPPQSEMVSVAGHFTWASVMLALGRANQNQSTFDNLGKIPFSCLTVLRHPVDRVISCYYFRYFNKRNVTRHMNEYTPDELRDILTNWHSMHMEGCNNEVLRIFGGLQEESIVNSLSNSDALGPFLYYNSLRHMSKCVVGLLHRWGDTIRVINHWYPWFQARHLVTNQNAYQKQDVLDDRPDLVAVIEELNYWDLKLYNHAVNMFEKQLRKLRSEDQVDLAVGEAL